MKKISVLFISIIVFCGCNRNHQTPKYLGLNGKIESIKDSDYSVEYKYGEVLPDGLFSVTIYSFDRSGNITQYYIYDDEGDYIFMSTREYENGQCCRITNKSRYGTEFVEHNLTESCKNRYTWQVSYSDKPSEFLYTEYFPAERYNLTTTTDSAGQKIRRHEEWYNKNGQPLEAKVYENYDVTYWAKFQYQKGLPSEEKY